MKTVMSITNVTVKVSKNDLIEGKWLNLPLLSKKLGEIEKSENMVYKDLRNRFYNSNSGKKYNTKEIAGFKCIDTENPMCGTASLTLSFERI